VEAGQLTDYFEPLLAVYNVDLSEEALPLADLLRRDWGLFNRADDAAATALLAEMLPDAGVRENRFVGKPVGAANVLANWESFRDELKYQNRFFPELSLSKDAEGVLFGKCLGARPSDIPNRLYRARTCESDFPYPLSEMGAPPKERATCGRANPRGIPYLYVASDTETAIHELRPHPGEIICVAEFTVRKALFLADLREPKKTVSPFKLSEDELVQFYDYIPYLSRLGDELSEPVLPRIAELEYLPSQYLSEFIKHCDFDGLIYRSAMGTGTNYALFSERKVQAVEVRTYRVDTSHVTFTEII